MENRLKPNMRLIPVKKAKEDVQLNSQISLMRDEAKDYNESNFLWALDSPVNHYVIFDEDAGYPVGVIGWRLPTNPAQYDAEVDPVWIRPTKRENKYAKRAAELLAKEMHLMGVRNYQWDVQAKPEYHDAACEVRRHFGECFNKLKANCC